jgi:tRNA G10  N-methylase Trm11
MTAAQRQARCRAAKRTQALHQIPQVHGEGYSLYQGDARQILPHLRGLDALITDPPYGVLRAPDAHGRASRGTGGKHGLVRGAYASYDDTYANFCQIVVPILNASLDRTIRGAVFSGPHIQEQRKTPVLGGVYCPVATGRHAWGFNEFHKVLFYGNHPKVTRGRSTVYKSSHTAEQGLAHPCPKPLQWMRWLVELASLPGETVFDPFMGSGTTGIACLKEGRRFVGIELDPGYFALAVQRLEEVSRQGKLFG